MDGKWHHCFSSICLLFCTLYIRIKHQGESNPPGLSKWFILQLLQFLKCENKARGLELPYEIRLPVEVYARVRVARAVHREPFASLFICYRFQAFLFASFSNACENNISWYWRLFCAQFSVNKTSTKQSKENKRVGNLKGVRHLGSFRYAKFSLSLWHP